MFIPMPVLIVIGLAVIGLAMLLLARRGADTRDLMRPPPMSTDAVPAARAITPPPAPDALSDTDRDAMVAEVRMLLMQGRKIEAIKQVRDRMPGLGLKEAKDWVEAVERGASVAPNAASGPYPKP